MARHLAQAPLELLKPLLTMGPLAARPPRDALQIDRMPRCNLDRLFEALRVRIMEVPREPIHDALGRSQQSQRPHPCISLGEGTDRLVSDRDRTGRELDPVAALWMRPVPLGLLEAEGLHGGIDFPSEARGNEVKIVRDVLGIRVQRDDRTPGEHDRDAVRFERAADEGGQIFQRGALADPRLLAQSGLPARRGRLRSVK